MEVEVETWPVDELIWPEDEVVVELLAVCAAMELLDLDPGDLVVAVGGERVSSLAELFRGIWRMGPAGTEIPLTLARGGGPVYVTVTSGDRNDYLRKPSLQ